MAGAEGLAATLIAVRCGNLEWTLHCRSGLWTQLASKMVYINLMNQRSRTTKTLKIKNLLSVVVVVKNFKAGLTLTETSYRMHY